MQSREKSPGRNFCRWVWPRLGGLQAWFGEGRKAIGGLKFHFRVQVMWAKSWEGGGRKPTELNARKPVRRISVGRRVPRQARGKDVESNRGNGSGRLRGEGRIVKAVGLEGDDCRSVE